MPHLDLLHTRVVGLGQVRRRPTRDERTHAGRRLHVLQKLAVISHHVFTHGQEELSRARRLVRDPQRDVQEWNERALRRRPTVILQRRRTHALVPHSRGERWILLPAAEEGADAVVENERMAALAHRRQRRTHLLDGARHFPQLSSHISNGPRISEPARELLLTGVALIVSISNLRLVIVGGVREAQSYGLNS